MMKAWLILLAAPAMAQTPPALPDPAAAALTAAGPARVGPADYICSDGTRVSAEYDRVSGVATVRGLAGPGQPAERTLFRAAERQGAATRGVRFLDGGLTVRWLADGSDVEITQRPLAAVSCARVPATPTPGVLVGTATYRLRMALPPGGKLTVQLADVARQDAPARVIAEAVVRPAGAQPPLHWLLRYDPAKAPPRPATYAVSARLVDAQGRLRYITDTRVGAREGEADAPVTLDLAPVPAPPR